LLPLLVGGRVWLTSFPDRIQNVIEAKDSSGRFSL
jgi:hypothetical protein